MRGVYAIILSLLLAGHETSLAGDADGKQINIEITTHLGDKQTFTEGDLISFYISLDRDAYVLILMQDARGGWTQLVPNQFFSDNHYKAGLFIPVPNKSNPFQFRVQEPFGTETLWAFASTQAFPEPIDIHNKDNLIDYVRASLHDAARKQNVSYGEAHLILHTRKTPR
jgi:hypothetical protein